VEKAVLFLFKENVFSNDTATGGESCSVLLKENVFSNGRATGGEGASSREGA